MLARAGSGPSIHMRKMECALGVDEVALVGVSLAVAHPHACHCTEELAAWCDAAACAGGGLQVSIFLLMFKACAEEGHDMVLRMATLGDAAACVCRL